jgi:hypothetical protein
MDRLLLRHLQFLSHGLITRGRLTAPTRSVVGRRLVVPSVAPAEGRIRLTQEHSVSTDPSHPTSAKIPEAISEPDVGPATASAAPTEETRPGLGATIGADWAAVIVAAVLVLLAVSGFLPSIPFLVK